MVTENTLLPFQTCPLCTEMKSIVIQNCGAIIYPMVLSPIANLLVSFNFYYLQLVIYANIVI